MAAPIHQSTPFSRWRTTRSNSSVFTCMVFAYFSGVSAFFSSDDSQSQTITSRQSLSLAAYLAPASTPTLTAATIPTELNIQDDDRRLFSDLCKEIDVRPRAIRLTAVMDEDSGSIHRGIHVNRPVTRGDAIFSVPLSACFRDDEPPCWFNCDNTNASVERKFCEKDNSCSGCYNPSRWATRLAAHILDAKLCLSANDSESVKRSTELWLKLLPDPETLRASLPLHWSAPILQSSCCTNLELAVDAAYFTRAQAVEDLLLALKQNCNFAVTALSLSEDQLRRLCDDALDIVQTRSCRVDFTTKLFNAGSSNDDSTEMKDSTTDVLLPLAAWDPPLRIIAPVFDFINHARKPNAEFVWDQKHKRLVVVSLEDVPRGDPVLIDYGDSVRSSYQCLASYGFVPKFVDLEDPGFDNDVAEVYIHGSRYDVTPTMVSEDIILAMSSASNALDVSISQQAELTPNIAVRLASRLSDVAYQLLLNPLNHQDCVVEDDESEENSNREESPHELRSAQLASSLRWNHHRVLLACAMGLRDYAVGGM